MRILGIDPGSRVTGLAVIEWSNGHGSVEGMGYWRPSCTKWACRVHDLFDTVESWLTLHLPDAVALEEPFVHPSHPRGGMILEVLCGVIEGGLVRNGYGWVTYPPRVVKQAVTGSGSATKKTVRRRLDLLVRGISDGDLMPLDVYDALAVAVCHAINGAAPTPLQHSGHREKKKRSI